MYHHDCMAFSFFVIVVVIIVVVVVVVVGVVVVGITACSNLCVFIVFVNVY